MNYIILGAGFARSVIAERIANVLNKKVLMIKKRNHIGGNYYDYRNKDRIIIHKYESHLFHIDHKEVLCLAIQQSLTAKYLNLKVYTKLKMFLVKETNLIVL